MIAVMQKVIFEISYLKNALLRCLKAPESMHVDSANIESMDTVVLMWKTALHFLLHEQLNIREQFFLQDITLSLGSSSFNIS